MATYVEPALERRVASRRALSVARDFRLLAPIGRALLATIFILAAFGHFSPATIGLASQQGVPMAHILVPFSGVLSLVGGLSVVFGFHARVGAWLLAMFLVPVTMTMHQFWAVTDPAMRTMQLGMFLKNLGLLGGVLLVAYYGAGPVSWDRKRGRH